MTRVAGVDVAGILARTAGSTAAPCSLARVTPGTRTPGAAASGTNPTTTTYSCRGYLAGWMETQGDGPVTRKRDRKICLYAATFVDMAGAPATVEPRVGDRVTITEDGAAAQTFAVVEVVGRGTAGARFVLRGRS